VTYGALHLMTTTNTTALDNLKTAKIVAYATPLTPTNYRLVLSGESYGEDGIFYPPQEIHLHGPAIAKLRELLNTLP